MKKVSAARLGVLAAAIATVFGLSAGPASATGGPPHDFYSWHLQQIYTAKCLDSDAYGDAYMNPCQSANAYQSWDVAEAGVSTNGRMGYQIRDVKTNLCLEPLFTGSWYGIGTERCNPGNPRQNWYWTPGATAAQFSQADPAGCLDGNGSQTYFTSGVCIPSNEYQNWTAIR